MPYGANINKKKNHFADKPVIANIMPIDAAAQSKPYASPARLHAKNMQNAAKYNGIMLSGAYAVATHNITHSAVHTAAVVIFFVTARI